MDAHDDHERPEAEPSAEDLRLRELLAAHEVPGPSADFVADTLLRLQLDQWSTPDPSPGFVDRVVTAWADERGSGPAGAVRELVPLRGPSQGSLEERRRSSLALFLAGAACAAALVLAFLAGRASVAPEVTSVAQDWAGTPEGFVRVGGNRLGRAVAVLVDQVDAELRPSSDGIVRPAMLVPTAPMPELAERGFAAFPVPDDFGAEVLFDGGKPR